MSDKPETLAAILAEMRGAAKSTDLFNGEEVGEPLIRGTKVEEWADRIEVAAERERTITDIMLAVKGKPLPHPDPDNAPPLFFPMTKTQLQTLSDLVAIAHDEMDGLPHHEQELERFDSLLFDMKARYAFDKPYASPGNTAALREALERIVEWADRYVGRLCFHGPSPEMDGWRTASHAANDALALARVALAAPARNCDVGTAADALAAYTKDRDLTLSPEAQDAIWWLFEKAEKEETK